jgi:hypothetical protein
MRGLRVARNDAGLVVTRRDARLLLQASGRARRDVDELAEQGLVDRRKVSGRWIYSTSESTYEAACLEVRRLVEALVAAWFLAPMSWLPGIIAKRLERGPLVTREAAESILREIVQRRSFGALGLLTQAYQPYLALFVSDDEAAVRWQVAAMQERLQRSGRVRSSDLPSPPRPTENEGWRVRVLQHGEFLGMGRMLGSQLVAWEEP